MERFKAGGIAVISNNQLKKAPANQERKLRDVIAQMDQTCQNQSGTLAILRHLHNVGVLMSVSQMPRPLDRFRFTVRRIIYFIRQSVGNINDVYTANPRNLMRENQLTVLGLIDVNFLKRFRERLQSEMEVYRSGLVVTKGRRKSLVRRSITDDVFAYLAIPADERSEEQCEEIGKAIYPFPFFAKGSRKLADVLASCLEYRSMRAGDVVYYEADTNPEHVWTLLGGCVVVVIRTYTPTPLLIWRYHVGDTFGGFCLNDNLPRTATIICARECQFAVLHRDAYKKKYQAVQSELTLDRCTLLRSMSVFNRFPLAALTGLSHNITQTTHSRNDVILKQGKYNTGFFLVVTGWCTLVKQRSPKVDACFSKRPWHPDEQVAVMGVGEFFGEECLLSRDQGVTAAISEHSVVASSSPCDVWEIPASAVFRAMPAKSAFWRRLVYNIEETRLRRVEKEEVSKAANAVVFDPRHVRQMERAEMCAEREAQKVAQFTETLGVDDDSLGQVVRRHKNNSLLGKSLHFAKRPCVCPECLVAKQVNEKGRSLYQVLEMRMDYKVRRTVFPNVEVNATNPLCPKLLGGLSSWYYEPAKGEDAEVVEQRLKLRSAQQRRRFQGDRHSILQDARAKSELSWSTPHAIYREEASDSLVLPRITHSEEENITAPLIEKETRFASLSIIKLTGLPTWATKKEVVHMLEKCESTPILPGGVHLQLNEARQCLGVAFVALPSRREAEITVKFFQDHPILRIKVSHSSHIELEHTCRTSKQRKRHFGFAKLRNTRDVGATRFPKLP